MFLDLNGSVLFFCGMLYLFASLVLLKIVQIIDSESCVSFSWANFFVQFLSGNLD